MKASFEASFLHPRYWTTWLWLGLWRLVSFLPYRLLLVIGKIIGLFLYSLPTHRKHIAATNLRVCYPELDLKAQNALLKANFLSMGIALMEVGMAWWWSKKRLAPLLSIEGIEHLDRPADKSILLLGMHFTTLEIAAAALNSVIELDGMYKAHKNPVYEFVQLKGRLNQSVKGCRLLERNNMRSTMKSLTSGRILWYLPDQDYGLRQALYAPFFGIPAATVYATARFAAKTDAAVVPVTFTRLAGARGYKITLQPALKDFPTGDDLADTTRINVIIEAQIRQQPEQYLWVHRRFKNQPNAEQDIYDKSYIKEQ